MNTVHIKKYANLTEKNVQRMLTLDPKVLNVSTIYCYTKLIMKFIAWLKTHNISPLMVSPADIVTFMRLLKKQGHKNSSINNAIKSIKKLYELIQKTNPSLENPVMNIRYYPEPAASAKYKSLTEEQLKAIYTILRQDQTERGMRNYALFNTLLLTGLRVSELCAAKISDVIYENNVPVELTVTGKGDRERRVEFNLKILKPILAYNKTVRLLTANTNTSGYFFFTCPTNSLHQRKPLDRFNVYSIIRQIGKKVGIKSLHPHSLRHTMASLSLKRGASLIAIKNRLGHAAITTTASFYLHGEDACLDYLNFGFIKY